jgi:hypothetical protein
MNEINVILEGKEYQIDIQKAKELGVIKEKDQRCKSWEEFKLKYLNKDGYFINSTNVTGMTPCPIRTCDQLTPEEALTVSAISKLLKLRRDWIGNWEPDWHDSGPKYCIINMASNLQVHVFQTSYHIFSFPTEKMAEEFLKCFEELFKLSKNH